MPFMTRCLAVPCGLARSAWLFRSCCPSFTTSFVVRQYSTPNSLPIKDLFEIFESEHTLEDVSEKPTVEQEGPGFTEKAEGGKTQSSGTTQRKEKPQLPTWDPAMLVDSSGLVKRPGLTHFLEFRELKEPPGLEFDPSTMSLTVSPSFPRKLHFHPPTHHKTRPWIEKAFLQRAAKWTALDTVDKARVEQSTRTMNRTSRRHRGNTFSHVSLLQNAGSRVQKYIYEPAFVRWARNMAPSLPERLHAHLDGIVPEDVEIYIEDHESYVEGHTGRVASCIWVAINASYSISMRACNELAIGNQPHPDWDILTPILQNLYQWLQDTYTNQSPEEKEYRKADSQNPRRFLPLLRDMIPLGHDIPVVLAFRQKYLLFILKGGIDGKLIAQYTSHWLPVKEGSNFDVDEKVNSLQLDRLRDGADEDAKPKISGGNPPPEGGDDPDFLDPKAFTACLLQGQGHEIRKDKEKTKNAKPPPLKAKQTRPSFADKELKRTKERKYLWGSK